MSQLLELMDGDGRRKVIERKLAVHCHVCGASLECPPAADFWFWIKCGDVKVFYEDHAKHAPQRALGAQIDITEKDAAA